MSGALTNLPLFEEPRGQASETVGQRPGQAGIDGEALGRLVREDQPVRDRKCGLQPLPSGQPAADSVHDCRSDVDAVGAVRTG